MKRDLAYELAGEWLQAHGEDQSVAHPLSAPLGYELMFLLPDECGYYGVAVIAATPTILGVHDSSLFLATVTGPSDREDVTSAAVATSCRRALNPATALVEVTSRLDENARAGPIQVVIRHRTWTFDLGDGRPPIVFSTRETLHGLDTGPDRAERVARAIADRLGFSVPDGTGDAG